MLGKLAIEPFSPNDINAVVVALAQAAHQGDSALVYCLEVLGDLENDSFRIMGKPFQVHNRDGRYIWRNDQLRKENIRCETVISAKESQNGVFYYRGNFGKVLNINQVISKLQFGDQRYNGVAYYGISHAFPNAVIAKKGIYMYQDASFGTDPEEAFCALIAVKSATIKDGRIHFKTRLDEEVNLKNNCIQSKKLLGTIDEVPLPLQVPLSDSEIGSVVLVSFGSATNQSKKQAVCEGILTGPNPNVIPIKNEPVKLTDGNGRFIDVPGQVVFDTGNDAGTSISKELADQLDLQPNSGRLVTVVGVGGVIRQFDTVSVEVVVRGHQFQVDALVGAQATDIDLLIGNDIIKPLIEKGFTIGGHE